MKKIINSIIILMTLAALFLTACGSATPSDSAAATEPAAVEATSINVLASTSFLADIAQNVAGDRLTVASLLPFGADPHAYQAAPTDVAKIAESNLLILNGVEYEHFIEPLLENAGGEHLIVEATTGLEVNQMAEEAGHEGEEDISPEGHAKQVCEQLDGKTAEEEVQSGADAASAVEMHGEGEHAHERKIITITLNAQPDGSFAGYLLFDAEAEEGYAFTSPKGNITVSDMTKTALELEQALEMDCAGMKQGGVYKLTVGEYIIALTGFETETIIFSAAPVHAHVEGEEGHDHSAGDPHMWLDPNLVITYVENIRDGLSEADPEGAETYKANADAYIAELKDLDKWIVEQVNTIPAERRLLVTNHEAVGYFAERYGFEIVGAVIPSLSTDAGTSAKEMAALIEQIKTTGAPAIFLSEVENADLANQIADETGVKVVDNLYLETLTDGEPAATYIDMMKHNVMSIVDGLK
jgi:ABC-type Zn uptake system ZnuABC Zn-binding protein ZnuA